MRWLIFIIAFCCLGWSQMHPDWGFFGHQKINRMAVFTLPSEMIGFYKRNIEFITLHSVDPDKRRYALKNEFARHYIDIDHWDTLPFSNVPRELSQATMKFGKLYAVKDLDTISVQIKEAEWDSFYFQYLYDYRYDTSVLLDSLDPSWTADISESDDVQFVFDNKLVQYGVLPYFLEDFHKRLTYAFQSGSKKAILRISADIGHYIGDAHVPLHTTVNYNGQLTNQLGLHAFWESRLPELFADGEYDFLVGKAEYIDDVRQRIWDIVSVSHSLLKDVLAEEWRLQNDYPRDQQFCFDQRSDRTVFIQCPEYSEQYHLALDGMVERRMQDAIKAIGDFWLTAWVDAGQPDINSLMEEPQDDLVQEMEELEKAFQAGQINGRNHTN